MDPIPVLLISTFVGMLGTAVSAMRREAPPRESCQVECPERSGHATVQAAWDVARRQVRVVSCDHRNGYEQCHEGCLPAVIAQVRNMEPSQVLA